MSSLFQPGQVISFVYRKGTNPNTRRLVEVVSSDGQSINGNDLNARADDRFRKFNVSEIVGVETVVASEYEEVTPVANLFQHGVKVDSTTAMAVYHLNHPNRQGVRFDASHNLVISKRNDLPCVDFLSTPNRVSIKFVNEQGKTLELNFDHPTAQMGDQIRCPISNYAMSDLAAKLANNVKPVPANNGNEYVNRQAKSGNPFYAHS